jgi:RNA recognition motif-containing protein
MFLVILNRFSGKSDSSAIKCINVQNGEFLYMKKLFVGNLAWKVSEESLRPLFEAHGTVVSVKVITDQYTGKSKGFAFVEMADADGAEKAIAALNDQPFMERNLRVSLANDRPERSDRGSGDRGGYRGGSGDRGDRGNRGGGMGGGMGGGEGRSFRPRTANKSY